MCGVDGMDVMDGWMEGWRDGWMDGWVGVTKARVSTSLGQLLSHY